MQMSPDGNSFQPVDPFHLNTNVRKAVHILVWNLSFDKQNQFQEDFNKEFGSSPVVHISVLMPGPAQHSDELGDLEAGYRTVVLDPAERLSDADEQRAVAAVKAAADRAGCTKVQALATPKPFLATRQS